MFGVEVPYFIPENTPYSKISHHSKILLFACKLALVASFKVKYSFKF